MKIYNYNKDTGEFTGDGEATPNPFNKKEFMIPAHAVKFPPLKAKKGFAVVISADKTKWEYIEDNRATIVYDITTAEEQKVDYLGAIKSGFTKLKPFDFSEWKNGKWVKSNLLHSKALVKDIESLYNTKTEEVRDFISETKITSNINREYEIKKAEALKAQSTSDYSYFELMALVESKRQSILNGTEVVVTAEQYANMVLTKSDDWILKEATAIGKIATFRTYLNFLVSQEEFTKTESLIVRLKKVTAETIISSTDAEILELLN